MLRWLKGPHPYAPAEGLSVALLSAEENPVDVARCSVEHGMARLGRLMLLLGWTCRAWALVTNCLSSPVHRVKEIGSTMSGRKGTDDSMTLQSQKFQIGDYLDIAITPPNRAPPPSSRMRPY